MHQFMMNVLIIPLKILRGFLWSLLTAVKKKRLLTSSYVCPSDLSSSFPSLHQLAQNSVTCRNRDFVCYQIPFLNKLCRHSPIFVKTGLYGTVPTVPCLIKLDYNLSLLAAMYITTKNYTPDQQFLI
jgi:hypothetical protein